MTENASLLRVLVTTGVATAVTTGAALLVSKLETGRAPAGLNATSHIVWGDGAARVDTLDVEHTFLGGVLNAGAMASWALVQELLPRARSPLGAFAKGVLVSALAYVVDYYVVPKRLTPGFEKRFSATGMWGMYAALAAALGGGAVLVER